ncbi:MAG: cell division protein SepF [Ruminiclostridium sp.]|nr:cell division protein SepF [Ruminiclostridium sp.]
MGFLDELKRLTHPYEDEMEDDYDEEEELYDEEDDAPVAAAPVREEPARRREYQEPPRQQQPQGNPGGKVVNIHATTQIQVVLVKPKRYDNAAEIANHLRDKRTVVLNLEETDENVARRLLDFLSGVAYAQEGEIKKVAKQTFLVTPYNVRFEGDLLDELENGKIFF